MRSGYDNPGKRLLSPHRAREAQERDMGDTQAQPGNSSIPTISFRQASFEPPDAANSAPVDGEPPIEEALAPETPGVDTPESPPLATQAGKPRVPYARFEEKVRQIDAQNQLIAKLQGNLSELQAHVVRSQGQTAETIMQIARHGAAPQQEDATGKLVNALAEQQPEVAQLIQNIRAENAGLRDLVAQATQGIQSAQMNQQGISAEMARRDMDDTIHRELSKTPELDTPDLIDDLHVMARGFLAGMTQETFSPDALKQFVVSKIRARQAGYKPRAGTSTVRSSADGRPPAAPPVAGGTPRPQRRQTADELAHAAFKRLQAALPQ